MPKFKTLDEAYDLCLADGHLRNITELNLEKIRSLAENAQVNLNSANILARALNQQAKEWQNVYLLHYGALHLYAEALIYFEKFESPNHQCLFAALCLKYSHLDLAWDFFEQIRTKRNGVNYYGQHLTYQDWKVIELQTQLYLSALKKELEKKLAEHK